MLTVVFSCHQEFLGISGAHFLYFSLLIKVHKDMIKLHISYEVYLKLKPINQANSGITGLQSH